MNSYNPYIIDVWLLTHSRATIQQIIGAILAEVSSFKNHDASLKFQVGEQFFNHLKNYMDKRFQF